MIIEKLTEFIFYWYPPVLRTSIPKGQNLKRKCKSQLNNTYSTPLIFTSREFSNARHFLNSRNLLFVKICLVSFLSVYEIKHLYIGSDTPGGATLWSLYTIFFVIKYFFFKRLVFIFFLFALNFIWLKSFQERRSSFQFYFIAPWYPHIMICGPC